VIEIWIPLTILAAFLQNLRSAFQKHLKSSLSTAGASYVRFLYACPFAIMYCLGISYFFEVPIPEPNQTFLIFCFLGGISQILFTILLIYLFSFRSFAVGTIYSKTEVIQVAFLSLIFLGDEISIIAIAAIFISVIGVIILSASKSDTQIRSIFLSLFKRTTIIGLACGAFLGASSVFYRGASLSLENANLGMRAAFALAVSVIIQSVLMGIYLKIKEPGQITKIFQNWRPALTVGVAGVLGSICWFTAFTIQNAAYVRALGQIELIFTFIASIVFFREKTKINEVIGICLITLSIIILLLN